MLNLLSSFEQIINEILQMDNTSKNNKVIRKIDFDVMIFVTKNNFSHNYVQMVTILFTKDTRQHNKLL